MAPPFPLWRAPAHHDIYKEEPRDDYMRARRRGAHSGYVPLRSGRVPSKSSEVVMLQTWASESGGKVHVCLFSRGACVS